MTQPTEKPKDYSCCQVCGNPNVIPSLKPNIHAFNHVCSEHEQYADYFQLDKVKVQLGYSKTLPAKQCAICNAALGGEELESIGHKDFSATCAEHRWMAHFYITSQFAEQYKKGLPFSWNGVVITKECPDPAKNYNALSEEEKEIVNQKRMQGIH